MIGCRRKKLINEYIMVAFISPGLEKGRKGKGVQLFHDRKMRKNRSCIYGTHNRESIIKNRLKLCQAENTPISKILIGQVQVQGLMRQWLVNGP
jgi:hypothetical protein